MAPGQAFRVDFFGLGRVAELCAIQRLEYSFDLPEMAVPTHGIPGLAQVLHHQAAQSSRAACHQNMLHTISSRVSLYFTCLSRERLVQKTRGRGQM